MLFVSFITPVGPRAVGVHFCGCIIFRLHDDFSVPENNSSLGPYVTALQCGFRSNSLQLWNACRGPCSCRTLAVALTAVEGTPRVFAAVERM